MKINDRRASYVLGRRGMIRKRLGFIGVLVVMLLALMASNCLGVDCEWRERTLPYRLTRELNVGWQLLVFLSIGFMWAYFMTGLMQAIFAVAYSGALLAMAGVSMVYFDSSLGLILVLAAAPLLRSGISVIKVQNDSAGEIETRKFDRHSKDGGF